MKVPVALALPDFEITPPLANNTVLAGFAILKCFDEDGDIVYIARTLDGPGGTLGQAEAIGALTMILDIERKTAVEAWNFDTGQDTDPDDQDDTT